MRISLCSELLKDFSSASFSPNRTAPAGNFRADFGAASPFDTVIQDSRNKNRSADVQQSPVRFSVPDFPPKSQKSPPPVSALPTDKLHVTMLPKAVDEQVYDGMLPVGKPEEPFSLSFTPLQPPAVETAQGKAAHHDKLLMEALHLKESQDDWWQRILALKAENERIGFENAQ